MSWSTSMDNLPHNATDAEIEAYLQTLLDLELQNGQGILKTLEALTDESNASDSTF